MIEDFWAYLWLTQTRQLHEKLTFTWLQNTGQKERYLPRYAAGFYNQVSKQGKMWAGQTQNTEQETSDFKYPTKKYYNNLKSLI